MMATKKKTKRKSKAVAKRPTGRPSKRTPKLIESLLQHLGDGGTVTGFCRLPGTPDVSTIERWAHDDDGLSREIARARTRGCDAMEQDYDQVSRTPTLITLADKDGKEIECVHPDDVAHRKLRIHALEKRLAWNDPAKYGAKQSVAVDHTHRVKHMTEMERATRVAQLLKKAGIELPAPGQPQVEIKVHDDDDEE